MTAIRLRAVVEHLAAFTRCKQFPDVVEHFRWRSRQIVDAATQFLRADRANVEAHRRSLHEKLRIAVGGGKSLLQRPSAILRHVPAAPRTATPW